MYQYVCFSGTSMIATRSVSEFWPFAQMQIPVSQAMYWRTPEFFRDRRLSSSSSTHRLGTQEAREGLPAGVCRPTFSISTSGRVNGQFAYRLHR